ncbi:hypothetical protein [Pseudovibrio exalbescens]|uniref:hypothetical protein n=1 Tax=Pseudovibrio exalbescens TaxID=197461 RepID=UPI001F29FD2E|nr:hypothetical protein [Pseudovibrio exalbescens]
MEHLSPLERELLDCVQQLTDASVRSNEALSDLEKRSTGLLNKRLETLEVCLSELVSSQQHFAAALNSLFGDINTFKNSKQHLTTAAKTLQQDFEVPSR